MKDELLWRRVALGFAGGYAIMAWVLRDTPDWCVPGFVSAFFIGIWFAFALMFGVNKARENVIRAQQEVFESGVELMAVLQSINPQNPWKNN